MKVLYLVTPPDKWYDTTNTHDGILSTLHRRGGGAWNQRTIRSTAVPWSSAAGASKTETYFLVSGGEEQKILELDLME